MKKTIKKETLLSGPKKNLQFLCWIAWSKRIATLRTKLVFPGILLADTSCHFRCSPWLLETESWEICKNSSHRKLRIFFNCVPSMIWYICNQVQKQLIIKSNFEFSCGAKFSAERVLVLSGLRNEPGAEGMNGHGLFCQGISKSCVL